MLYIDELLEELLGRPRLFVVLMYSLHCTELHFLLVNIYSILSGFQEKSRVSSVGIMIRLRFGRPVDLDLIFGRDERGSSSANRPHRLCRPLNPIFSGYRVRVTWV